MNSCRFHQNSVVSFVFLVATAWRRKFVRVPLLALSLAMILPLSSSMQAQTFHLLYTFTNGSDGANPYATVTLDRAGNLYGTTFGYTTNGGVYELQRHGSSWIFKSLYNFQGTSDGTGPQSPVIFGPDETLYGTTKYGGNTCNGVTCGTVYNLQPPAHICSNVSCPWTEHPIYWFGGVRLQDGYSPGTGSLMFDASGNLYGTTASGGTTENGIVYELVRSQGSWSEHILADFPGDNGPAHPQAGVALNATGNLLGTTVSDNNGYAYELTSSGQGWALQTIHTFQGGSDGSDPMAGLIFDAAGNAYGATTGGGSQPATVFELTPQSNGTWTQTVLHEFAVGDSGPHSKLAMDSVGNLYGTTEGLGGGDRFGFVFKLSYANGAWSFTDLYDFMDGTDGVYPVGGVTVDAAGNLYGTCSTGGAHNFGTVWEITP
jgi:uncharacterized repeat protein (TIGR03803 family)